MIGQVTVLLRVKTLKEEQALRRLEQKRQAVVLAARALAEAEAAVIESAASLPGRIDAVYDTVMKRVVDQGAVDDVKARVLALETEHQALQREAERCAHVLARLEAERDAALADHRNTLKNRDKYVMLRDRIRAEMLAIVEQREEGEIEELAAIKRKRFA